MATPTDGLPGTEMTSISFRDQLWLSAYPLDRNLVFDYFALSPFYDRTCNNEQLRMEAIHPLDMTHLSYVTCFPTFIVLVRVRMTFMISGFKFTTAFIGRSQNSFNSCETKEYILHSIGSVDKISLSNLLQEENRYGVHITRGSGAAPLCDSQAEA